MTELWQRLSRVCGLPLGGNQKLLGHGPGQSALSVPAWAGLGPGGPRNLFPPQPVCDSLRTDFLLLGLSCVVEYTVWLFCWKLIVTCLWKSPSVDEPFTSPPELLPAVLVALADRGPRAPNLAAGCRAGCMLRLGNWAVPQRCPLLELLSSDLIKLPALCCMPSVNWGKICKAAFGRQCESYS